MSRIPLWCKAKDVRLIPKQKTYACMYGCWNTFKLIFLIKFFSAFMKCFDLTQEFLLQLLLYQKRNFFSNDHNLTWIESFFDEAEVW